MTELEKLKAQLAELQAESAREKEGVEDPKLLEEAKQYLQYRIDDIVVVFEALGLADPTVEELQIIEKALINSKLEQLKQRAEKPKETLTTWRRKPAA